MKYTVSKSYVYVLGNMWSGGLGALQLELSAYDLENAKNDDGVITRDSLERWLCLHCGDFSGIEDFSASLEPDYQDETLEIDWKDEENEFKYNDCFPDYDD